MQGRPPLSCPVARELGARARTHTQTHTLLHSTQARARAGLRPGIPDPDSPALPGMAQQSALDGRGDSHPTLPRQVIKCSNVILSSNQGRLRLECVVNSRSTLNPAYQSCDRCTLLGGRACHLAFMRAHRCALLCAAWPVRGLRLRRREKPRVRTQVRRREKPRGRILALCSQVDALCLAR